MLYKVSLEDFEAHDYFWGKWPKEFIALPGPGMVSLTDFVKFHKPPNTEELLRLIQENMQKKITHKAPIVALIENQTDLNLDDSTVATYNSTGQAANEPQPKVFTETDMVTRYVTRQQLDIATSISIFRKTT